MVAKLIFETVKFRGGVQFHLFIVILNAKLISGPDQFVLIFENICISIVNYN